MTQPPIRRTRPHALRDQLTGALAHIAQIDRPLAQATARIRDDLWAPPRVVVVGRVKAGKSTLVNALIGDRVADTAATECTKVVAVYQDGAPSRAEIITIGGARRSAPLTDGRVTELGCPAEEVAYLNRYLPSLLLRRMILIDTPGLATITAGNEQATRRALIDGFGQTRDASVNADAAIFLFDATPRSDEVQFLHDLGFSSVNTIGVLAKADTLGEGAFGDSDPIEEAQKQSEAIAASMSAGLLTVQPVAGLLAQTAQTGQFTESDADALAALAGLSDLQLEMWLEAQTPSIGTDAQRDRLLDLLGEYGLRHARGVALRGAHAVNAWLQQHSRVDELRANIDVNLTRSVLITRAIAACTQIEHLALTHPAGAQIRSILRQVRQSPQAHTMAEFKALSSLTQTDPESPWVSELRAVLVGSGITGRIGLPPHAHRDAVAAELDRRLRRVHEAGLLGGSAAEEDAVAVLLHTYSMMRRSI
ncbi:dynamin family protein [Nocardia sp. 348MFTsu5.1]|uniref:dynamin family protein n=1 Tax=Nocardia sp. 348MFTsu5.1 TaxID=1172185 RepID=UPI000372154F|nr:dynamin family protein [Nocardia sp. 348MFTsu5.1]